MNYVRDLLEELLESGWQCWRVAKELNNQNIVIAFDESTHPDASAFGGELGWFATIDDFYLADEVPIGMATIKVSEQDIELLRQTTK